MPQLIELKQNRNFIEPDFPGYKLSLQEIPKSTLNLNTKVHIVYPTNEQYSYKHVKLFTLHNHILASELDNLEGIEAIYYIGGDRLIYKVQWDILGLEELCMNWKVPQINPKQDYNFTMHLPNEQFALVSDGCGSLYLIDRINEWKCVFNDTHQFSFVVMDSKIQDNILHVLLFNITHVGVNKNESKHMSVVNWVQYKCIEGIWRRKSIEEIQSESELHYALIASDTESLFLLSSEGGFDVDGGKEVVQSASNFTWCQNNDSVSIFVRGSSVDVKKDYITIRNCAENVVEGQLFASVDSVLTTWTIKDGLMEIILCKVDDLIWPELIRGKTFLGEYLPDEKTAKEVHDRLAHLCSENKIEAIPTKTSTLTDQVEECDFVSSKGALIERITANKKVSHRVILTQEIIFINTENPVPMFGIQQNEDVCLYSPLREGDTWSVVHFGSLFALGYIRASKQRRKFTTSAPDLSYSVVAESSRHLFIYRQNVDVTSGELRHRMSGRRIKQLAQQQVVELDKDDLIIGIKANNNSLFVLSENKIYVFKMK